MVCSLSKGSSTPQGTFSLALEIHKSSSPLLIKAKISFLFDSGPKKEGLSSMYFKSQS